MSLAYLARIDGDLIREHGLDAAVLHALIRWRTHKRPTGWVATAADIFDDIGLRRTRYEAARNALRDAGLLTWEACGGRQFRWSIIDLQMQDSTNQMQDPAFVSSYKREPREQTPAAYASAADEESHMDEPIASVTPIDGGLFPAPEVEPRMDGRTLYAAWWDAYVEHYKCQPDASVNGPLAGAVRTIVKSRTDPDSWRDAIRAFTICGKRGAFLVSDIRRVLVKTGPTPSQFEQRGEFVARLATGVLTGQPAIENPAAKALGL